MREAKGWTLADLSDRSRVSVGTISALENRDSQRSKYAVRLARALGVSAESLYGEQPLPSRAPREIGQRVAHAEEEHPVTAVLAKYRQEINARALAVEVREALGRLTLDSFMHPGDEQRYADAIEALLAAAIPKITK